MSGQTSTPAKFLASSAKPDDFAWVTARLRILSRLARFVLKEVRSPVQLPFRKALAGWTRGFSKLAFRTCQLDLNPCQEFVPDFHQSVWGTRINGFYDQVLNNKLLLPLLMSWAGAPTPDLLGYSLDGKRLVMPSGQVQEVSSRVPEILTHRSGIAVKPIKGHKGQGFLAISRDPGDGLTRINRTPATAEELASLLDTLGPVIVTEFVNQAGYSREFYPATTNTLRILTLWDTETCRPFIAAAVQRIGTRRSFPTDNWRGGLGGISAAVDLTTGELGPGAFLGEDWRVAKVDGHPETGARIAGTSVAHWEQVAASILNAAGRLPFAAQIGWDVVVTESGCSVIEVNGCPGLHLHQVHRPLLQDPRVRVFYERNRVIRLRS